MQQKRFMTPVFLLLLGIAIIGWANAALVAEAESPTNVTLSSFTLTAQDNAVLIEWTTDTEIDVAGFFLERGENGTNFARLTNLGVNGVIAAQGSALGGFDYVETDDTATNGATYSYKLYEIETNSNELLLAQKTVTLIATATPAPIGGTFTPPTNTPLPSLDTATPTRQATTTPNATRTPSPTASAGTGTATQAADGTAAAATATGSPTPFPSATISTGATATPTQAATEQVTGTQPPPQPPAPAGPPSATPTPVLPTPEIIPLPTFVSPTPSPTAARPTPVRGNSVQAQESDALSQAQPIGDLPPTEAATAVAAAPEAQAETTPENARRGRLLLWIGFLVALLIFGTSVVGSIFIFTRRQ